MNEALFAIVDLVSTPGGLDPGDRVPINLGYVSELSAKIANKFGAYDQSRAKISEFGRMSRDLSVPFSCVERGYDSLDAIRELVGDWIAAFEALGADRFSSGLDGRSTYEFDDDSYDDSYEDDSAS